MRFISTLAALAVITLLGSAPVVAQSLQLAPDDTVLTTDPNPGPLDVPTYHVTITNVSASAATVYVIRHIENLPSGQSTHFCFGTGCYAPATDTSADRITIPAGGTNTTFVGYVDPQGVEGYASISYDFVNTADGSVARQRFQVSSQVTATKEAKALCTLVAGPSPANGILHLAPSPGLGISLYDAMGRKVRTSILSSAVTEVSIVGLTPGSYMLATTDGRSVRIAID